MNNDVGDDVTNKTKTTMENQEYQENGGEKRQPRQRVRITRNGYGDRPQHRPYGNRPQYGDRPRYNNHDNDNEGGFMPEGFGAGLGGGNNGGYSQRPQGGYGSDVRF